MLIVPTSRIILLKNPIEIDYMNELTFSSKTAQYNYFYNLPKLECDNATYQRKDEVVRFPTDPSLDGITYDDLIQYNYCMYQNDKWSNKWFYAFVKSVTFDNPGMSYIELETDVWQSWMFDITFKRSFVEREHVNDDTVGKNTIPENLELGPYVSCNLQPSQGFNFPFSDNCFVVAVSELLFGLSYSTLNVYIPMGLYYIGCTTQQGVKDLIAAYDDNGKGDAINSVFISPKAFFSSWGTITYEGSTFSGQFSTSLLAQTSQTITIDTVNYLGDDYVPVNKKLLTFPYTFLQVSNNLGTIVNYNWENFNLLSIASDGTIKFRLIGVITPGCEYRAYPLNYNNILDDYDDGITLGKLPVGSWTSDVYTNWLTQNGVNIGLSVLSNLLPINSADTGSILGGFLGIGNTLAQIYQHSLIPDQVGGNVNCGDVNYQFSMTGLYFKRMSIKNEYARIIDNYFSAYGYKVNTYKTPNIYGRSNWNFVKTIGCNIIGNIPQNDLQKIKDIFNNGVTFWHNPSTFLDYSQSNAIV